MKRAAFLSTALLVVFGMSLGIVVSLNEDAQAVYECVWQCTFKTKCTTQTGPECPGTCPPSAIYYIRKTSTCTGGPLNCPYVNEVIGCWNGEEPCIGCLLGPPIH